MAKFAKYRYIGVLFKESDPEELQMFETIQETAKAEKRSVSSIVVMLLRAGITALEKDPPGT